MDIQEQALKLYEKNMEYISKFHSDINTKLLLFARAVQEQKIEEKYVLEYMPEGYFDVKNRRTSEYLYKDDSNELAKSIAKSVNHSKQDKIIEGFFRCDTKGIDLEKLENEDVTSSFSVAAYPIIEYANRVLENKNEMRFIKKFIFLRAILSTHIEAIDNTISNRTIYLILEKDIELFYHSLFVTDYANMSENNQLYICVGEDKNEFRRVFDKFFHDGFILNHYIKYFMLSNGYQDLAKDIMTFIIGQSHLGYSHDQVLKKLVESMEPIKKRYSFLNIRESFRGVEFEKRPVVFVGAGPSLDKNMEWLKKNQKKFIIISVFVIVPRLKEEGITPDVIMHIHEDRYHVEKLISQVNLNEYAKKTIFVLSPSLSLDSFDEYNMKDRIFLLEDRTHYKINNRSIQGVSVGDVGYGLSLIFNPKEMYLLGLDLALEKDSGRSHAQGHHLDGRSIGESDNVTLYNTHVQIKGNFENYVTSIPVYEESIIKLNKFTKEYKQKDQNVYNLNDGAYFENIKPKRSEDIDVKSLENINKEELFENIKKDLQKYSSSELNEREKELFEIRYQECRDKIKLLDKFSKTKFVSLDKFYSGFVELVENLISYNEQNTAQLSQVLNVYFHNVAGYVYDMYNSITDKNTKVYVKEIQKLIYHQLKRLILKYEVHLEELIENKLKKEES